MTELSKKFETLITTYNKKLADSGFLIPVRVENGIMIGDILIKSNSNLKTVVGDGLEYKDVFLNYAAITIANLMALRKDYRKIEEIYYLDQDYGRYFSKSQYLITIHSKYLKNKNYEKADTIWAKYQEARDRANIAKAKVDRFLNIDK